ncbi:hypothetical protein [Oceanobacillus halotolerans]|uniref:hypothetical protein n=1 Tax=Oceanobacillus halotolerans TaxID=2663380 RepID=UPI0013DA6F80|nr:hypothetical protein [Oceanobacillus halotolerans]
MVCTKEHPPPLSLHSTCYSNYSVLPLIIQKDPVKRLCNGFEKKIIGVKYHGNLYGSYAAG